MSYHRLCWQILSVHTTISVVKGSLLWHHLLCFDFPDISTTKFIERGTRSRYRDAGRSLYEVLRCPSSSALGSGIDHAAMAPHISLSQFRIDEGYRVYEGSLGDWRGRV